MKYRNTLALVTSALIASTALAAADQAPSPAAAQTSKSASTAAATTVAAATPAPASSAGAAGPAAPSAASDAQIAELSKPSGGPNGGLYTVKEGNKVDPQTLNGWKTWRALACERCHGAEQEGLVGPPLVVSLHRLTKDEFKKTVTNGRIEKGMPPFNTSHMVMTNLDGLYAYLKGRADGQIKPGHLYPLDSSKK